MNGPIFLGPFVSAGLGRTALRLGYIRSPGVLRSSPLSARRLPRYSRRRRRRPTAQIFVGLFSGNEHPKMVCPPLLFAKPSSTQSLT